MKKSFRAAQLEFKKEPMDSFYNNLIIGFPSRLRVKKIIREIKPKNKTILDVGCEAGYVSLQVLHEEPLSLYAIDIVKEALDKFREKLKSLSFSSEIVIKKASMQKTPFSDKFFDAIICTEVIEHSSQLDKGFKELRRVLRNHGKLIITFPNEKLRKKVYPIVKLFGIDTKIEDKVTLFEYDIKDILTKLKNFFDVVKVKKIPWFFPITHFIVCRKNER